MRLLTKFNLLGLQILLLLGMLFIYLLPIQQAPQGPWVLTADGSKVWYEMSQLNEIITWSGSRDADGYATGQGKLQWFQNGKPGNTYEGNMLDGKKNGKGIYIQTNGDRYEGDFVDDKRSGKGILTWTNGNRYEGDFVDGKRTGKGILTWSNGDRYDGEFVNDKQHGHGTYMYYDGRIVSGQFENDEYKSQ